MREWLKGWGKSAAKPAIKPAAKTVAVDIRKKMATPGSRPVVTAKPVVAARPMVKQSSNPPKVVSEAQEASPNTDIKGFGSSSDTVRRPQRKPVLAMAEDADETLVSTGAVKSAESQSTSLVTIEEKFVANRHKDATPIEAEEFINWQGEVTTSPNGSIPLTDTQRRYVAMLGDGRLLIAKGKLLHEDTLAGIQSIRRQGRPVDKGVIVELDVLRIIYQNAEKNIPKGQGRRGRGDGLQEMQKQVLALIDEASKLKASDIHIKINRFEAKIFFRTQGVMDYRGQMEADIAQDFCTAAFNMADASDATYRPNDYQGARISDARVTMPEGVQSVRLQFNPLPNGGRYMVCRLLYSNSQASTGSDVDTLGYTRVHVEQIVKMRRKPYGINIISGPTGSGKSTTLQRALTALMHENRGTINVITIEDPPEYVIENAAQLPVLNAKTDEDRREAFRAAISASLRSDPDVIMIGEIRDAASSNLAFTAAMTGHGVWASLHANDALCIIDRLRDQGVEIYKLTDEKLVTGLIGQRLIRRLCNKCSVAFGAACNEGIISGELAEKIISMVGEERAAHVKSCGGGENCPEKGNTCSRGYVGREVVAETVNPDNEFMTFMRDFKKKEAYDYWLENLNGMTMLEHALQKLVDGKISPHDMESRLGDINELDRTRIEKVLGEMK